MFKTLKSIFFPVIVLLAIMRFAGNWAVLGPRQVVDLAIPPGLDGAKIFQFNLRTGVTAQTAIAKASAAIGAVNEKIASMYGGVTYYTQALFSSYTQGGDGVSETPVKVEGKQADPVKTGKIGHMLPMGHYEDALGWTQLYLIEANETDLDGDVALISNRWWTRIHKQILRRALTNTQNAIGTSGYDVGWADGNGTLKFIPPQHGDFSFDATHTHYIFVDGTINSANLATLLENQVLQLIHHGHVGRLVAQVSFADITKYAGITKKFSKFVPQGIQAVAGSSDAPVLVSTGELQGNPGEVFGLFLSDYGPVVELRWNELIPTGYSWMYKSYGTNNLKNPIAMRLHPGIGGFGLRLDPILSKSANPELEVVLFKGSHGVGVNDPTNGVAGYCAPGAVAYVNPASLAVSGGS